MSKPILKRFSAVYMAMLLLGDCLLIFVALEAAKAIVSWLLPNKGVTLTSSSFNTELTFGLIGLWFIMALLFSVYTPQRVIRWFHEFGRIWIAHTFTALVLAGLLYLLAIEFSRQLYWLYYGLTFLLLITYRIVLRAWHRLRREPLGEIVRVLLIGSGTMSCQLANRLQQQRWLGVEVVGFLEDDASTATPTSPVPRLGSLAALPAVIKSYAVDEVIIAIPAREPHQLVNIIALLFDQAVRVRIAPAYFELAFFGSTVESWGGMPLVTLRDPALDGFQRLIKRLMDLLLSLVGLILCAPLMALIALAIKGEDGGPIFYPAARVGENGQLFTMLKFRSMIPNADVQQIGVQQMDNGHILHKHAADPRVTRIGRFLRRTSLDELPQLLNVLRGEMSLVGPRPELPWLVAQYEPWQRKRLTVPQGMTGWWQVNGRSDNVMHLHTEQDIYYIQNYSLWLDLQILARTIPTVFRGRGAY